MVPRTWNGGQLFNIVEHGLHHYLHHLLFHVDVDVFVKLLEDREDDVETFSADKVGPALLHVMVSVLDLDLEVPHVVNVLNDVLVDGGRFEQVVPVERDHKVEV